MEPKFFLIFAGVIGVILSLTQIPFYIHTQSNVPCQWMSDKVLFGGRIDYQCSLTFTPQSSGTYSYYLKFPGNISNLKSAYISISNVQQPIEYISLSGTIPPQTTVTQPVNIPEYAYNVKVIGEIIGIQDSKGNYPSYPYISGGNYVLNCTIQCTYNRGVIIDKPGSYNLQIFSGYGGGGIQYKITGQYYLPTPSLTVNYDTTEILSIQQVTSPTQVDVTNKFDKSEGYLTFSISGIPKFTISFTATMTCSLSGGEWQCVSYYSKQTNKTVVQCTKLISSTCDFYNINSEIPLDLPSNYFNYFKNAQEPYIDVLGKIIYINPGSLSVLIPDLPQGTYNLRLYFELPYIIPEAKEAVGTCMFDKTTIEVYGSPGREGYSSLTVYNFGDKPILVKIYPSNELVDYVSIRPVQYVINPKTSTTFDISIKLPDIPTTIGGYIYVEGCTEQPYKINMKISTTGIATTIKYLPSILIFVFVVGTLIVLRPVLRNRFGNLADIIIILTSAILLFVLITFPIQLF